MPYILQSMKRKQEGCCPLGIHSLGLGLCLFFQKLEKRLFLFNMTEGSMDSEAISLICCSFPESSVHIFRCLRRSTYIPQEE